MPLTELLTHFSIRSAALILVNNLNKIQRFMSFLAKLELDGETYNVLDCTYGFEQSVDRNNKPSGTPRGGQITLIIESRGSTNFLKWMVDHKQTKDGTITFFKRDAMSRMLALKFSKAFCIRYTEHFNAQTITPMQMHLTISAKKIEIEGVTFENTWNAE
ncbi:MAG: type VI secretion system tube protein TssD [Moheibacter sp.]